MSSPTASGRRDGPAPAPAGAPRQSSAAPADLPVLVVGLRESLWLDPAAGPVSLPAAEAARRARRTPPLVCHARASARRLGCDPFPAYDLLELFAFVRPAAFCTPTPRGLTSALGLPEPTDPETAGAALRTAAETLLREVAGARRDSDAGTIARVMAGAGWPWGPVVLARLAPDGVAPGAGRRGGLDVWERLPAWSEQAPPGPPGQEPVSPTEARGRLAELLGEEAEARPQQADYASAVSQAFLPRAAPQTPRLLLAEAGTGVGKTLGYLASASLWAEKNEAPVWISTFTRNLQHQIDGELDRLYPTPKTKAEQVVLRKGRENYLCLLNLEEAAAGLVGRPQDAVAVGLMARWAARTRDGDMVGGDFPGWLADLAGRGRTLGLTDRRGECIYAACRHYGKCFIERSVRRARHARIVVANHALVMVQAALGAAEEGQLPSRYVFDEGHHLFAAADSAFSAHLSGQEGQALRRWLLGAEGARRSPGSPGRARGLRRRVEDLIQDEPALVETLEEIERAARVLPAEGWHQRLASAGPQGPAEVLLAAVRAQVYARSTHPESPYGLEVPVHPVEPELLEAARRLGLALERLHAPLEALRRGLETRLDSQAERLDSDARRRLEASCRSIERRGTVQIAAWRGMLADLESETPDEFIDWLAVERSDGRDLNVGLHRHWVDPTRPFAETLLSRAHGVVVTSATLTDGSGDPEADWSAAEARSGASHLEAPVIRARVLSPYDYAAQTRVLVIQDLDRTRIDRTATAYRELFLAAGGGALGLFTAIARLRAVHGAIGQALEAAGLELYAQHVDGLDTATLVDIFRAEENACLLGTDAVRDGVDVPGRSLRLIVFDKVPWPRPDIAHKARRAAFGGSAYDDRITRLRLRQAFGRLIRRADDRGVFVLLDRRLPSRLAGAFPEGVAIRRLGLAEAIATTREFLAPAQTAP